MTAQRKAFVHGKKHSRTSPLLTTPKMPRLTRRQAGGTDDKKQWNKLVQEAFRDPDDARASTTPKAPKAKPVRSSLRDVLIL